jgi:hypothetical protein
MAWNRPRFEPALVARLHALLELKAGKGRVVAPVASSIERLHALQRVLSAWPVVLADEPGLPDPRRRAVQAVGDRCSQLLRTLADVGAAPPQLEMLDAALPADVADSPALELSLLADEVAWQLRALNRLARRRWRAVAGEAFPPLLQGWLDDSERIVGDAAGS